MMTVLAFIGLACCFAALGAIWVIHYSRLPQRQPDSRLNTERPERLRGRAYLAKPQCGSPWACSMCSPEAVEVVDQ